MPVGKRIYLKKEIIDPEIMEGFRSIPSSNVADVMNRLCGMNSRIRLMSKPTSKITVGSALTIKTTAGDNLMIHAVLDIAREGDFIVVDNEGGSARSLIGCIMMQYLRYKREIAGIVLDGPIRDIEEIGSWDFPVYATGTNPGGPYKNGPGEINVPITCGNISVSPGDIIHADSDGVIVIPRKDAREILTAARKFQKIDEEKIKASKFGTLDRTWVNEILNAKGIEIVDDICN